MEKDLISKRVKNLILQKLEIDFETSALDYDTPLIEFGLGIDSVTTLEFIVALENEFGISIDETEVGSELLESINTISEYLTKYL